MERALVSMFIAVLRIISSIWADDVAATVDVDVAVDSLAKYSEAVELCQKQFGKDQIGSWKPKYLYKDTLPVCKEKLVYMGNNMSRDLIDLEKNLCMSEELELIVNNCPLNERYFRQIAKLSGLPLEGSGGRLLQLSIQRCFATERLYGGKYNYGELFRCIADQEKSMKGSVKLFETHKIMIG